MQSRPVRRAGTGVLISAIAGGLLLGSSAAAGAQPVRLTPQELTPQETAAVDRYDSQKLSWQPCLSPQDLPGLPAAYYRLECATMLAPRDWAVPQAGVDLRIKVSRLMSTAPGHPGMLFSNPGGPGAEGVDLPLLLVSAERKKLMASQDVYGMDVRGTGGSSNLTCGGVQDLTVDPRVRTPATVDLLLDAADLTAQACAVAGADLLPYVTTAQTVQDVDLLRRLAGHPKVNWLGFSAGTWLGAHYATMFPDRAGHLVFDSNVQFTGTWQAAFDLQPMGFQRRFESDFAPWVAKWNSVYGLGPTPEAVIASYERLRARMTPDAPVEDAVVLDEVILSTMYAKAMFPDAAAALAELSGYLRAQSSGKFRTAARYAAKARQRVASIGRTGLPKTFSGDAASSVFLAVTCQDTPWTGNRASLAASSAEAGQKYPLLGYATIDQPCSFWDRPVGTSLVTPTGQGLPPVLMVQSEHDPATPIEGARIAASNFAGARLLTVTGEGDHGLYAGGNACVDRKVDGFIIDGKLPAEGATCKGTAMPDPGYGMMRMSGVPKRNTNPLLALRQISEMVSP
jgi:pimeloyl-ACP methyl ester carboxylesterase